MKSAFTVSTVIALALGLYGWFDTAQYRAIKQAYQSGASEHLQQASVQLKQEEGLYRKCDTLRQENPATRTIDFTPEGRQCLIDALAQTHSVQGALNLSRNASVALGKNPQDSQLRSAALGAIDNARQTLASHKPWLYDRLEQLNHAYADSLVLRVFIKPDLRPVTFDSQAALLDQAENAIHLPKVHQSQQIWRLEAMLAAGKSSSRGL